MNIPIIASHISGIKEALEGMGFDTMQAIAFIRSPMRVKGRWRAEVRHG